MGGRFTSLTRRARSPATVSCLGTGWLGCRWGERYHRRADEALLPDTRLAPRRRAVLLPRPSARRSRARSPLPAAAGRPDLEPGDRSRQGLRPHAAARSGRGGLPRDGRASGHQGAAPPMSRHRLEAGAITRLCREHTSRTPATRISPEPRRTRVWQLAITLPVAALFSVAACSGSSIDSASQPGGATRPTAPVDGTAPSAGSSPTSNRTPIESSSRSTGTDAEASMAEGTPITIRIGDAVLDGRLSDNPTAQDLIAQLPLTLEFRDLNGVEKIARLPRELTMDGVPEGDDPEPQDIGYYAPSNDLVFYYEDVGYFDGIVRRRVRQRHERHPGPDRPIHRHRRTRCLRGRHPLFTDPRHRRARTYQGRYR
jgi:hypothetical protein